MLPLVQKEIGAADDKQDQCKKKALLQATRAKKILSIGLFAVVGGSWRNFNFGFIVFRLRLMLEKPPIQLGAKGIDRGELPDSQTSDGSP